MSPDLFHHNLKAEQDQEEFPAERELKGFCPKSLSLSGMMPTRDSIYFSESLLANMPTLQDLWHHTGALLPTRVVVVVLIKGTVGIVWRHPFIFILR